MAQYDRLANDYVCATRTGSNHVCTESILIPFLESMAPLFRGSRILDFGCGDGFFTRKIMQLAARSVRGVDISSKMIDLARVSEKERPLGIRYDVGDFRYYPSDETFQVFSAIFVLNYATSRQELEAMCTTAFNLLENNGAFLPINDNQETHVRGYYTKYGLERIVPKGVVEGGEIQTELFGKKGKVSFINRYWKMQSYIEAMKKVGFKKVKSGFLLPPKEVVKAEPVFWEDYLARPSMSWVIARK